MARNPARHAGCSVCGCRRGRRAAEQHLPRRVGGGQAVRGLRKVGPLARIGVIPGRPLVGRLPLAPAAPVGKRQSAFLLAARAALGTMTFCRMRLACAPPAAAAGARTPGWTGSGMCPGPGVPASPCAAPGTHVGPARNHFTRRRRSDVYPTRRASRTCRSSRPKPTYRTEQCAASSLQHRTPLLRRPRPPDTPPQPAVCLVALSHHVLPLRRRPPVRTGLDGRFSRQTVSTFRPAAQLPAASPLREQWAHERCPGLPR